MKMAPHRRFGGSSVAEIFIFLSGNKNCPLFVKEIFFYLCSSKSYRPPQFFAESVSSFFFGIILKDSDADAAPHRAFHPIMDRFLRRLRARPCDGGQSPGAPTRRHVDSSRRAGARVLLPTAGHAEPGAAMPASAAPDPAAGQAAALLLGASARPSSAASFSFSHILVEPLRRAAR